MKPHVNIIVLSLSSPLQIGIYDCRNGSLMQTFKSEKKTSEALPALFEEILKKFTCEEIVFARGPGSFMAIKITYIFLRTLAITKDISLLGSDGFAFNKNSPISAMKNLAFIKKEDGTIVTEVMSADNCTALELPLRFNSLEYSEEIEPLYVLPAV